jgi:hypothetical protein
MTTESPPRLSQKLARLRQTFAERPVRLRETVELMAGRGYTLLLALIALPFCTPIPLPGLSTPFGLVIAVIGLRLSLRLRPWLPERLLNVQLPSRFFPTLLGATARLVRLLEFFLRPRLMILVDWTLFHHLYGLMILVSGLLLLLPLPIPMTNFFPALTVVLLAVALLERDGGFIIAGSVMFALSLLYFGAIWFGGAAVVEWVTTWFGGLFEPGDETLLRFQHIAS